MCGIAGIIQKTPRFGTVHLHRMMDALSHRGPDGNSFWCREDQQIMLGHRRLAILDLRPEAAQPMHFEAGDPARPEFSIVHNGEIYNYIELRKQLRNEGYTFNTESDTEVILAAYDFWREECVEKFDGMFAFAIWDQHRQELFAARDRFGEKPFYFHFDKQKFLFASEMKALWAAGVPRRPNQRMLFNYLTIGYTDNPSRPDETFFEEIFQLPPASCLFYSLNDQEPVIEKYWDIDLDEQNEKITDGEAAEQVRYLLSASVRRRLRSDVSLGCSLSGGLDSNSVARLVRQHLSDTAAFSCYTAHFPEWGQDESATAARSAQDLGFIHHSIEITAHDLADDWWAFCRAQEVPVTSASAFAQFKVYEHAAMQGCKVLLDGQGADETLAGYSRYYKWYWQELFQKRKLRRSGEIEHARALGVQEPFGFRNIMAALFPELAAVILERQYLVHALRHEDLHPEFVRSQSRGAFYATPEIRHLNGQLYFNSCVHGLGELLRYADRNSMHWGREVRLPFLDHQLVEFVFQLPARFKIREGWTKWILRHAMQDQLPSDIVWQKKKIGFEPPQKDWMQEPAMKEVRRAAREKLVQQKILRPDVLNRDPVAGAAYDRNASEWRYLAAGSFLQL